MFDIKNHPVPENFKSKSFITQEKYQQWYEQSISEPDTFWADRAKELLSFNKPWEKVQSYNFKTGEAAWFEGAKLNVCYNCVDRHLETRPDQVAIIWEGDKPDNDKKITYRELFIEVCKLANTLKARGVKKGDRVCIYMPMIPEAAYAMLACTRIGAIHSVVFGGFSPEALANRILDSDCQTLITADEGVRGGKTVPLKANADIALAQCPNVHTVLTVQHTGGDVQWHEERDVWYHEIIKTVSAECMPVSMAAEDPLFILYTSGSTGKPKGVLHTTAGYLLHASLSHKTIFDYHDGDIYWCTADVGWVTGHSYIVYGPLANGATTLMFEGVPNYPDASRCWQVVDKHQVNIFYTAPTALRALMAVGNEAVKKTSRKSLQLLGTVGEPINPEAWEWYYNVVGEGRCPIVDTWWQTETGGIMISPFPGATELKPGSAAKPFFGVELALLDTKGNELEGPAEGSLVIKRSWPGQIRSVFGNHQRCIDTYFTENPGYYTTGDGARRDADGYYWITGRTDDVLNVSGHRLGTAEIESALVKHNAVAEAAVVGFKHNIKGQGIYAYVTLMNDKPEYEGLVNELKETTKQEIGAIAKPDFIQFTPALPKTRSGKIMRRILRKIAANELNELGDTSTLADPSVVDDLINKRLNR